MLGYVLENGSTKLNERGETFELSSDQFQYNILSQGFSNFSTAIMIEVAKISLKSFLLFKK